MCDEQHWIIPEYLAAGHYRGFCPTGGYYRLSSKAVQCFTVSDAWIVGEIAVALGIGLKPKNLDKRLPVMSLGRARFGPYRCEMFFGRRLADRCRFEKAIAAILEKVGSGPAVLLTSTNKDILIGSVPKRCAVIGIENVLKIAPGKTSFDEAPILAALRGPNPMPSEGGIGFRRSPGFHSCVYGDEEFRFSAKQALAVEALHDAWMQGLPGLHQDELMGITATTQRMAQLFYRHPAYGSLIAVGENGFYRLNL
jgi:hypothetical protein